MAELAVAATLGTIQIILPLLQKLNLPINMEEDIESMRGWLPFMERLQRSRIELDQVEKVGKIAYDIEDVLDDFMFHSPPYTFHHYTHTRIIHTYVHHVRHGFPLWGIKARIQRIEKDIQQFQRQATISGNADSTSASSSSATRVTSPLLLDEQMVGYETQKAELMCRLVDEERRLVRVAVDGVSGSGKTTLVKNVFWKSGIQAHFDCHAWVHVSQNFDIEQISKNLLLQLCSSRKEQYPADDGYHIQTRLRKYLAGKRYLIVFDDIWKPEHWNLIKDALPDSNRRSRIIITTNNTNVSYNIAPPSSSHDHICSLAGLKSLDGWKLFCRKAFPHINGECPSEIKDTATKIVTRCEGLPYAIVAFAGALAKKPFHEWERFHNNLGREIGSGSNLTAINDVLQRSYMDLSGRLKCCFLYMSVFPEDYSVERGRLVRLWVAEGFAMATDDLTAEEVAEDYLNELIHRNLIHVSRWDFDGRPRSCRLLNIVLKFIIVKCKEERFVSVFPRENSSRSQNRNQRQMIRRLSVHDYCDNWPENLDLANVRSLLLLRLSEISPSDLEKNLGKLKLIKVLDFQGVGNLKEFPKEINCFTLVKYLSFRDTKIKVIPSSIKKLSYLETLDLKQTDVIELPEEISHLQNLCHLLVYKYNVTDYVTFESAQGVKLQKGISKLTNLQSLSLVKLGKKNDTILRDLKALTQLRKLGLTGLKQQHSKDLCASVEVMKNMKTLDLCSATKEDYIDVEDMKNPPEYLQRLYLKGRLARFPMWITRLNDVVRIGLLWSKLKDSPLQHLQGLPNLLELQLVDCYSGKEELTFEGPGFKKLKMLQVEEIEKVKMIVIEKGALCELEKVTLRRCKEMRMVLGVENLKKMEELSLYDMAEELVGRLRRNGEDGDLVEHVPFIRSFTHTNRGWLLENLSHLHLSST